MRQGEFNFYLQRPLQTGTKEKSDNMEKDLKKIELDSEKGSLVKEFPQERKNKRRLANFLFVLFGLFFWFY